MIGQRLKFERERIGMTQPEFAAIAGVSKRTLIDWEKGVSSPTAVQLSALMESGVDVFYVLTGQRIVSLQQPAPPTQEEIEILANYRLSREEDRQALARTAAAMAKQPAPKSRLRQPKTAVVFDTEYKGKRTGPTVYSTEYTGKRTGPTVISQDAKAAPKKKRKDGPP